VDKVFGNKIFSIMLDEISIPSPYLEAVFLLLSPTLPIMEEGTIRNQMGFWAKSYPKP
jgi:hypothetical protein